MNEDTTSKTRIEKRAVVVIDNNHLLASFCALAYAKQIFKNYTALMFAFQWGTWQNNRDIRQTSKLCEKLEINLAYLNPIKSGSVDDVIAFEYARLNQFDALVFPTNKYGEPGYASEAKPYKEYLAKMQQALNLRNETKIQFLSPFLTFTDDDLWLLAEELGQKQLF